MPLFPGDCVKPTLGPVLQIASLADVTLPLGEEISPCGLGLLYRYDLKTHLALRLPHNYFASPQLPFPDLSSCSRPLHYFPQQLNLTEHRPGAPSPSFPYPVIFSLSYTHTHTHTPRSAVNASTALTAVLPDRKSTRLNSSH